MALAGARYGRVFQRAANDRRGGWLFGAAFGFLLWTAGAVLILPLLSGGIAPAGNAAVGLYLSLVLWAPQWARSFHMFIGHSILQRIVAIASLGPPPQRRPSSLSG